CTLCRILRRLLHLRRRHVGRTDHAVSGLAETGRAISHGELWILRLWPSANVDSPPTQLSRFARALPTEPYHLSSHSHPRLPCRGARSLGSSRSPLPAEGRGPRATGRPFRRRAARYRFGPAEGDTPATLRSAKEQARTERSLSDVASLAPTSRCGG